RRKVDRKARRKLERVDFHALSEAIHVAATDIMARLPDPGIETSLLALSLIAPFVDEAERELPADPRAPEPERLHKLRIALKKVRYGVELLQPLFGEHYRQIHLDVERLQELLGTHHDMRVLASLSAEAKSNLERQGLPTLAS